MSPKQSRQKNETDDMRPGMEKDDSKPGLESKDDELATRGESTVRGAEIENPDEPERKKVELDDNPDETRKKIPNMNK